MKTYMTTQNGPVKIYDSDCEPKWISIEDKLPPIDEEVIVLTDIIAKDGLKVGFGRICFAHRPNPDGWDGKDIFTGKVTHHDVVTYDGWNIPGVKYWMPCPKIPEK